MKFFQRKPKDERVVAEINQTYRIGFYILSIGMLIDLYHKWAAGLSGYADTALESLVLLAACIFVLVQQVRRGFMDENVQYAESDTFPVRHYLLHAVAAGVGASALLCVLRMMYGSLYAPNALVLAVTFVSMVLFITVGCMAAYYLMFRLAKRRRARLLDEDDG